MWRGVLVVALLRVLNCSHRLVTSPAGRRAVHASLLLVGLVIQGVLLLTAAYLIDLAVSLMELWTALARKHLELTL